MSAADQICERLGARASRDAPLGSRTTYRVGGTADVLVEARRADDLLDLAAALAETPLPVLVVGRGSNLLVADAGFRGVAVVLTGEFELIAEVDERETTTVRAGGAVALPVLARRLAERGWRGLEWAVGVPGSVGGAVRMNAGGHGSDVAASLVHAELACLADASTSTRGVAGLALGYRCSNVRPDEVVVAASFHVERGDPAASRAALAEVVRWRRAHQPGGSNAGSVFANPEGDAAGRLIDAAGAKGRRHGTAQVSDKHANFIQSDEGGRADDVYALIGEVRELVAAREGVELRTELVCVGFEVPRVTPRHAGADRRRGTMFWVGVVAACVVVLGVLGSGAWFALHSRLFAASTVTVVGERHESAAQVVDAGGLRGAPAMISVDPAVVADKVRAAFPWVDTVTVTQRWPHTVAIEVTERVPVATVKTKSGAVELVDVTGRRLGAPGHGQALPGLQYALRPGSPDLAHRYGPILPREAAPGLVVAGTLPPAFRHQVAVITVDTRGWVTLHLSSPVTFELGPASNLGAKYEAVAAVIKHTTLHVGDVVDVSVPQASTVTGP